MLQDVIYSERICGYDVSILLYSVEKEYRDLWDNRNHYYDIRISYNDELDSFDDVFESIYTKKEAYKLFKKAKEIAKQEYDYECKKCDFDMGEGYENNGASEDGVCNYCGFDQEKSKKTGTNTN